LEGFVFRKGDLALFAGSRGGTWLQRLQAGGRFNCHRGWIAHDAVLGSPPGLRTVSSRGEEFFVFRPTLADCMMRMPRRSGIVYPKDAGVALMWADVFPGARVLMGSVGTGALLLATLRQVGPSGRVVAYDVRQDMLDHAAENMRNFLGGAPNLVLRLGSVYERVEECGFDRALLDVPEPWRAVETLRGALLPGGAVCAYLPSVNQVKAFVDALRESGSFAMVEAVEILLRGWHLAGRSVRLKHRMVGHTGFLVFARKTAVAGAAT